MHALQVIDIQQHEHGLGAHSCRVRCLLLAEGLHLVELRAAVLPGTGAVLAGPQLAQRFVMFEMPTVDVSAEG